MREHFLALADALDRLVEPGEVYLASFHGEVSDFARLNHARPGQAGSVRQGALHVDLVRGRRHVEGSMTVGATLADDCARARSLVSELREALRFVPEDPYLLYATRDERSDDVRPRNAPDALEVIEQVCRAARGTDLVGVWASGEQFAGFASSCGQRDWYARTSFNLDWSLHAPDGAAVKRNLAGEDWDAAAFAGQLESAREDLALLARPARPLQPGRYRAYLAPAAVAELAGLLAWGAFSLKSHRTRQSPFTRLADGQERLDPRVTLREDHAGGISPRFTSKGFAVPAGVTLIDGGAHGACLVAERSAAEYGEDVNAGVESPRSLDMAPGRLGAGEVLTALGTGLLVSNLWYCNYSDRAAGRITGMTRFACFWVEGGRVVAPVPAMRFDETLYHLLGEGLVDLTEAREQVLESDTYYRRSTGSMRVPGILVDGLRLAL